MALGASRLRVARLLLVESLILSTGAGIAALGLSVVVAWALEGTTVLPSVPPLARASLDWRVIAWAFAASTTVALTAGVFPAFAGSRVDVGLALQRESRSQTGHRQRLRRVLSAVQVMLSMTLMIGAGLLARSMWARLSIAPGFDATRVMTFSVEPNLQRYGDRARPFFDDLLERVRAVPGVRAAAMSWIRPTYQPVGTDTSFRAEGAPEASKVDADSNMVSPGFFEAIGLPLVEGREFSENEFQRPTGDTADQPVIMTESLARRTFGPGPAVGRRIVMSEGELRTVVGVVRDTRQRRLTDPSTDMLFRAIRNTWDMWASVEVGLAADANVVMPRVREAVRELDPTLPIYDVMRVDEAIRAQFAGEIFLMRLALVCAGLATLLAAVGLYGVLARGVTERRRELGIRSALGASPADVARLIAGEAFWIFAGGAAAGIAVSLWLGKYLESRLYGVTRLDAVSFAGALVLIAIVMVVSTTPATRRAARTDPSVALRG
jgi:predicted permease